MARNLADPAYEPTDEELQQLSRDAFAHVGEQNRAALAHMRERIKVASKAALARVTALPGKPR